MANVIQGEKQYIDAFLRLTLKPTSAADVFPLLKSLTLQQRQEFVELADANHVVVRAFEAINRIAGNLGNHDIQAWAVSVLTGERERITTALSRLEQVCDALEDAQCATVVMKTLDHLPDLGNDLDVVVVGDRKNVLQVFTRTFNAKVEARSWGDRLANKWNFVLPGLRESIEAHIGRLGQMGEHKRLAQRFIGRRVRVNINGNRFFMPAHEERIYAGAQLSGIWTGVASFLSIVSGYVQQYRGTALRLPAEVLSAASVGADKIYTRARFLRIPLLPYAAKLYTRQLKETAFRGDVPATLRLSLLPPLASAAAVAFKITGSDKGIW